MVPLQQHTCACSAAASGQGNQAELLQQELDMAAFLEAFPGNKAGRQAELEGMQLASRASNRAGLDAAALAAMEEQVRSVNTCVYLLQCCICQPGVCTGIPEPELISAFGAAPSTVVQEQVMAQRQDKDSTPSSLARA